MLKGLVVGVITSLVLVFGALPVFASGALGVMTLSLEPSSGQVGTAMTVSGKNAPQTALSIWISPESDTSNVFQLMAPVQPNADGTWQAQVYIPGEWPKYIVVPGTYLVTVQDQGRSYVQEGEFTVLSVQGMSPSPTATPAKSGFLQSLGKNALLPVVVLLVILGALGWAVNYFAKKSS